MRCSSETKNRKLESLRLRVVQTPNEMTVGEVLVLKPVKQILSTRMGSATRDNDTASWVCDEHGS